jgi:hypothetical protein
LKGQHPRGLFYPRYRLDGQSWLPDFTPVAISVRESAAIALRLLHLAETLQPKGLPAAAYLHGVSRMAEALLGSAVEIENLPDRLHPDSLLPAGAADASPALLGLFLELHRVTGKDAYRKTVLRLKGKLFSDPPQLIPLSGGERGTAEAEWSLLQARTVISLLEAGYPLKGARRYFDSLLLWLHLNNPEARSQFNPMGGLRPAFHDNRLLFRGFELAHTLLRLNALVPKTERFPDLAAIVSQLLGFTMQQPLGTSCYDLHRSGGPRFGPLNSQIWMEELYYFWRLTEEFPELFT